MKPWQEIDEPLRELSGDCPLGIAADWCADRGLTTAESIIRHNMNLFSTLDSCSFRLRIEAMHLQVCIGLGIPPGLLGQHPESSSFSSFSSDKIAFRTFADFGPLIPASGAIARIAH